jgi:hypothetical protein
MIDKNCPICFGVGLVCANHPLRVWDSRLGCTCGDGVLCSCTRPDEEESAVIEIVVREVTLH